MKRFIPVLIAAFVASLFIACGEEMVKPLEKVTLKTKSEILFTAYKEGKEDSSGQSDPSTGMPCDKENIDSNGDGVITNCTDGGTASGNTGEGGYGAMPLCPEIIGLDFSTCPAEKGRPVFIIDFGRSCVLGMKCDYQTDPGQACPMVWAPVCGIDGMTYDNDCFAKMAGMEIAYEGECQVTPVGCKELYPSERVACPDGTVPTPVKDEMGCVVGFECGSDYGCPEIEKPVYNKCPDSAMYPIYDYNGCIVGWDCSTTDPNQPVPCKADGECGAGLVCLNGLCSDGTTTDPTPCSAIYPEMPACGDNVKPNPVYDAAGCLIAWECSDTTTDPSDPNQPVPCKADGECGAGMICLNGLCSGTDDTTTTP